MFQYTPHQGDVNILDNMDIIKIRINPYNIILVQIKVQF